jgi:hypothetical protein
VCGEHPTVTKLIDYEMFCGLGGGDAGHETAPARTSSAA